MNLCNWVYVSLKRKWLPACPVDRKKLIQPLPPSSSAHRRSCASPDCAQWVQSKSTDLRSPSTHYFHTLKLFKSVLMENCCPKPQKNHRTIETGHASLWRCCIRFHNPWTLNQKCDNHVLHKNFVIYICFREDFCNVKCVNNGCWMFVGYTMGTQDVH